MACSKINKLKIFNPSINKILREDRYDTEDISEVERKYVMKNAKAPRVSRVDLSAGDIVVVLEGAHAGKKVVFIKQLPNNIAVVSGVRSVNGVSAFKIDERYLFKLSAKVEMPTTVNINADNLYESKMYESEKMEAEATSEEKALEDALLSSINKIKFMRSYLSEPFVVDNTVEFYSQEY